MKLSSHKISLENWTNLTQKQQLLNLAAELARISLSMNRYGSQDRLVKESLERAFDLVDLILQDPRWKKQSLEWRYFRDGLSLLYLGKADALIAKFFYTWLINFSENL
ncbi:hypothetical protein KKH59_03620 [Patescibacteria group bacterium]|nr:hypothetical protein [Patescibacteria group bacterium]